MERIKEYLNINNNFNYVNSYENHYGGGTSIGYGDINCNGRAFSINNDYYEDDNKGILEYNGHKVYYIDGYLLYITHIRKPGAIGIIIKNDLTTQDCYLGKINNNIVVVSNLHDGIEELRKKIIKNIDNIDDIVEAFVLAHPNYEKEYDWEEMLTWHSLDKTSCLDGRKRFSKFANKGVNSKATPKELVEIMKNFNITNTYAIKLEKLYLGDK